jgi:hypothetical protein
MGLVYAWAGHVNHPKPLAKQAYVKMLLEKQKAKQEKKGNK